MIQVFENCYQLRGRLVHHYALFPKSPDEGGIVLIDGGFLSSTPDRWLPEFAKLGYRPEQVEAILVTHGHIDHTLNLARWKDLTGARLFAPRADRSHIEGRYPYTGIKRICGCLEASARLLFSFEAPEIDEWFEPGQKLPFWDGLEVIGLPGHTHGHSGFYSPSRKLLLAGDLFSSFRGKAKLPPAFFNDNTEQIKQSIATAAALDLSGGVLHNHCHPGTREEYRCALETLATQL